jgi:hypothetical protein
MVTAGEFRQGPCNLPRQRYRYQRAAPWRARRRYTASRGLSSWKNTITKTTAAPQPLQMRQGHSNPVRFRETFANWKTFCSEHSPCVSKKPSRSSICNYPRRTPTTAINSKAWRKRKSPVHSRTTAGINRRRRAHWG